MLDTLGTSSPLSATLDRLSESEGPIHGYKWRYKPTILVVDDDPSIPPLVQLALEPFGLLSIAVGDGEAGIHQLHCNRFDLLILDLNMDGLNGFDILQTMKREARLRELPVIVLTGDDSDDALARSFGHGADDLVVKPFKLKDLGMRAYKLLNPLRTQQPG